MQATTQNVFYAVEAQFAASRLASVTLVDQGQCGEGLPECPITVAAARNVVHAPATNLAVCDAVFAALVRHSRTRAKEAQLVAIWVMLPGLRAIAHRLRRTWRTDVEDIQSDVVLGFLEALRNVDPSRRNLGAYLWWTTYRHARRPCENAVRETAVDDIATLATYTATSDHANNPLVRPIRSGTVDVTSVDSPVAESGVAGERIGSLAYRLGLHRQLRGGHRTPNTGRGIGYLTLHNGVHARSRQVRNVRVEREDDAA
jgi:hypothetical protein